MSVTIMEALQNGDYNLKLGGTIQLHVAKSQIHNAVTLLDKGYGLEDNITELLDGHAEPELVPEKR